MKNKKSTIILLLVLCIAIWGTIGWKVVYRLNDSPVIVAQVVKNIKVMKNDSVCLLLNYRDPFLDDYLIEDNPTTEIVKEATYENSEYNLEVIQETVPDFQYKGTIRIGKVSQAIVVRQDESILLNVRDKIGEFTVSNIAEEVLTVSRAGKQYQLSIE